MYTYEKFYIRLLPWFFVILGIVFTFSGMYLEAALFGTPGGLFAISFKGFTIDAPRQQIRHYDRFLWFSFGKWHPFSNPLYVTVVSIKLSSRRNTPLPFIMPSSGKSSQSYKMNLVVDGKERYIPLTHGDRTEMLSEAIKVGKLMNIRVLDYTTHEKRWVDL